MASPDQNQHAPAFARSPMRGKRTSDVKARVTDEVKFALQRRCAELGITESDYIDRLLCVSLFGPEAVREMDEQKTHLIMGWWHKLTTPR
jgi:hypothetical protein